MGSFPRRRRAAVHVRPRPRVAPIASRPPCEDAPLLLARRRRAAAAAARGAECVLSLPVPAAAAGFRERHRGRDGGSIHGCSVNLPPPPAPVQSDRMKWEKRRCMGVGAGLTVPATGGSVGRSTGGGVGAGPDHTPWDGAGNVALPPLPYDDACPPPLPHHVGRPFHLEQGAPAAY